MKDDEKNNQVIRLAIGWLVGSAKEMKETIFMT
jgi:hypothetical protein